MLSRIRSFIAACFATPSALDEPKGFRAELPAILVALAIALWIFGFKLRAFLGLAVFYRYAGLSEENQPPAIIQNLVTTAMRERARVLGAAFRVAHLISAARPGVLPATHFRSEGRTLTLVFEHRMVDLVADRVGGRFKQLARLVGRSGTIVRR